MKTATAIIGAAVVVAGVAYVLTSQSASANTAQVPTGDTMLSPNFSLAEFVRSSTATREGIDNTPNAAERAWLQRLAREVLEPLRSALGGNAVRITSGFRSQALNDALPSASSTSQHRKGQAVDFKVDNMTAEQVTRMLWNMKARGIPVDQVIKYAPARGGHVHVSISASPRGQFLFAPAGSTGYIPWSP